MLVGSGLVLLWTSLAAEWRLPSMPAGQPEWTNKHCTGAEGQASEKGTSLTQCMGSGQVGWGWSWFWPLR